VWKYSAFVGFLICDLELCLLAKPPINQLLVNQSSVKAFLSWKFYRHKKTHSKILNKFSNVSTVQQLRTVSRFGGGGGGGTNPDRFIIQETERLKKVEWYRCWFHFYLQLVLVIAANAPDRNKQKREIKRSWKGRKKNKQRRKQKTYRQEQILTLRHKYDVLSLGVNIFPFRRLKQPHSLL
jgi:hypothetical protein